MTQPDAAPAKGEITRLDSASAQSVLERVEQAGLIERGGVAIISVDAIRRRTPERWNRRQTAVWSYVVKKCADYLSVQDIHHRLNDTDFLIAMTAAEPAAVQATGLRILEEVLEFFLGAAEMPDVQIKTLTSFAGGAVVCTPIDPRAIVRAPARATPSAIPAPRAAIDPAEERRRNPVSFVTAVGQPLRIDFAVEPVVHLRRQLTAALRIEPTVTLENTGAILPTRALQRLSDEDLARVDQAALDYGALYVPRTGGPPQPAIILPLSFRSLAARKGRQALAMIAGGAGDVLKSSVMVEFVDVDRSTPVSRLTEVAGLVASLCRATFVRLQTGRDMLSAVRGYRPQGLTFDLSDIAGDDAEVAAQILAFGEQAHGAAPLLMVQGLPNSGFFDVAQVAGATHGAVRGRVVTRERSAA